ncbi:MAG: HDOD domain-containing protein [Burkholderiaceae bacterium]|nr:HDOD domain-containing protein [Burkholderiaceae bacterium]
MSIAALFDTPQALPTIPKVAQELIQSFSREDVAVEEIARQLSADPVLSAKTLRLANSAYFHVSRQVASVDDAIRMLGFVMIRNLVIGCSVTGAFKAVPGLDLPQFWRHSLHTACGARWLAQAVDRNADLAFTVGLVHGVGHLVMHAAAPSAMKPLDAECHPLAFERTALEQTRLGYHHGEVGAELAARWKFPAEVSDALRVVADPMHASASSEIGSLVHIAAWRSRVSMLNLDAAQALASCPSALGRTMGLPVTWLAQEGTLGFETASGLPSMPPLAELTSGLEAMLD